MALVKDNLANVQHTVHSFSSCANSFGHLVSHVNTAHSKGLNYISTLSILISIDRNVYVIANLFNIYRREKRIITFVI